MSDDTPMPPPELPSELVEILDAYSAERLRHVARYAETLADNRARASRGEAAEERESEARPDDRPDGVPPKATITIKEINDNRYYYWQWREGDKIKSTYKGPVADE